ncbi:hypothetical protein [Caulobacter sp. UNC358MFTsu5.1]|uniref:hypothetical protein n=1 Tax=Caulobacter sp. UNC358MFTsu5.1 TaxID=1449049 RepID=UPI0004A6ECC6|nr:hypothetical protein [Caulobacter sp. UNC358MFTsu5.1]
MGRRDVIEVPKAHRPPDPTVIPRRPNVWTFRTAVPPDQVGARLAATIGTDVGPNGAEPVVGVVTPTGAELHRRPTSRKSLTFRLTLDWTAQAEGSLVTCRTRLPIEIVLFIGVWMVFALMSLGAVPGALVALATHADHVAGFRRGSPVSHLIDPLVTMAVGYGLFRFMRAMLERDRAFLMEHVTRVLEAGPVREAREEPGRGAYSPFSGRAATTRP